jgi:hypothetical protein
MNGRCTSTVSGSREQGGERRERWRKIVSSHSFLSLS